MCMGCQIKIKIKNRIVLGGKSVKLFADRVALLSSVFIVRNFELS